MAFLYTGPFAAGPQQQEMIDLQNARAIQPRYLTKKHMDTLLKNNQNLRGYCFSDVICGTNKVTSDRTQYFVRNVLEDIASTEGWGPYTAYAAYTCSTCGWATFELSPSQETDACDQRIKRCGMSIITCPFFPCYISSDVAKAKAIQEVRQNKA